MRLYFERIDPDEDKFVATVKGDNDDLVYLLQWFSTYKNNKNVVDDIKKQVENARKKFEDAKK